MSRGKAPSQRQLRVGEELRHMLVDVLTRGHFRDPDLAGRSITVSEVRVSPDLKNATAFVIPMGDGDPAPVIKALGRAQAFIRSQVAKSLTLRHVPRFSFVYDESFDEASHINELLNLPEVRRDIAHDPLAGYEDDEDPGASSLEDEAEEDDMPEGDDGPKA